MEEENNNQDENDYYDEEMEDSSLVSEDLVQQMFEQQYQLQLDQLNNSLNANKTNKETMLQMLNLVKQNPQLRVDQILSAQFTQNIPQKKTGFQAGVQSVLQSMMGKTKKENSDDKLDLYFNMLKTFLYGSIQWQGVVKKIAQNSKGMGVCAKVLRAGDVAWKCEDCEKDSTCIICQECFENSNHKGHRVWLKTNVGGCCDCGDIDGWEESGFCKKHKGFAASTDAMLSSLPQYVRENSLHVFASLCKSLKGILLELSVDSSSSNDELKKIVAKIFMFFEHCCNEIPSNIYFISQSLLKIFYGQFETKKDHKCCHRYFTSEEYRNAFETEKNQSQEQVNFPAQFVQNDLEMKKESLKEQQKPIIMNINSKVTQCTCSVLDLICATNQIVDRTAQKQITNLFFKMFQSYEFKKHLGMAYAANLAKLSNFEIQPDGILSLGVQLLTIEEIILLVMRDPELCSSFTEVISERFQDMAAKSDKIKYYRLAYLMHDLKYMCKPLVAPIIINETDFLLKLLLMTKQMHFIDSVAAPEAMEEYQNDNKFELVQTELDLVSKIERYLQYVTQPTDIKRVLATFLAIFQSLNDQLKNIKGRGFFIMPVNRLFSYFVGRVLMKAYIEQIPEGVNPALSAQNPFNFYSALSQYLSHAQIRELTSQVLECMSIHLGFIAEIKSKKWVYKGEAFQRLPLIKVSAFKEYFLTDLGLVQMLIVASQRPAESVEILIKNFGTDQWLQILQTNLIQEKMKDNFEPVPNTAGCNLKPEKFAKLPRFDVIKLSSQLRQLLYQLIHIFIVETSFLHGLKNLFSSEDSKDTDPKIVSNKNKQEKIFAGHLKRVVMHDLFVLGASTNIEQIKKATDQLYVKSDHFMPTLIELSDKTTDADGKIRFRLKEDQNMLASFDPFFIIQEENQSTKQAAYESLHKKKSYLNNIVGDYQHHYKYQTSVNKTLQQAVANCSIAVKIIASILKQCFEVVTGLDASAEEKDFRAKLFNVSIMNAALKLQLIISENMTDPELKNYVQRALTPSLFEKMITKSKVDEKFEKILQDLQRMVYPPENDDLEEEKKDGVFSHAQDANDVMKAVMAKRKQMMMNKMKQKQQNFIDKSQLSKSNSFAMEVDQKANPDKVKEEINLICATCQEPCLIEDFWSKPFVQLGYSCPSKLLYYSYIQTLKNQKQSLKNSKAAIQGLTSSNSLLYQSDPEEETKEANPNKLQDEKSENWKDEEIDLVFTQLGLKGVIDSQHHTGVALNKCCHYQHFECLQSYLTTQSTQQSYAQVRMRSLIGMDHGVIQCPFCKGLKNTWQPFLPLRSSQQPNDKKDMEVYITFFNQLIQTQLNNQGDNYDLARGLKKEIMLVDIEQEPTKFVNQMMEVVTHLLLTLSSIRNNVLWANYDPQVQSDDVCLRDIVLIIISFRRLLTRIGQYLQKPFMTNIQMAEALLEMIQADQLCEEESSFGKNYSKTIIKLVFAICLVVDDSDQSNLLIDAVFQSAFSGFKTQVAFTSCFLKGFGEQTLANLLKNIGDLKLMDEEMIQSSLHFLRTASACMLIVRAVGINFSKKNQEIWTYSNATAGLMSTQYSLVFNILPGIIDVIDLPSQEKFQLGLDTEFMKRIHHQVDDGQEFMLLIQYLNVNQSMEQFHQVPVSLKDLEDQLKGSEEQLEMEFYEKQQPIITLQSIKSIRSATGLDLKVDEMLQDYANITGSKKTHPESQVLKMSSNLYLLTPYFTFNFIELPGDYQRLVKDYYNRKCRYCKTQVQKNALCLLCGEVVCLQMKDQCCNGQPGQLVFENQANFFGPMSIGREGELSYHARKAEGGCSLFIVPSTSEVILVDCGRITHFDSFYRNLLGETFSKTSTKKWENFYMDEKSGGTRIFENLKKLYVSNKVPQKIMELRQKGDSVILRHVY